MVNNYARESRLMVETFLKDGHTDIKDSFFSAPFKITNPFYDYENNMMRLCIMNISPGMLEGDFYNLNFILNEESRIHVYSQSYGKVFSMKDGYAEQRIKVILKDKSRFEYYVYPTIPYKESSFRGYSEFFLEGKSELVYREILSCGRYKMGESFQFNEFSSSVKIYRDNKLLLFDNAVLIPHLQPIRDIGFYEGFTHTANVFIAGDHVDENMRTRIYSLLEGCENIDYGVSLSTDKCLVVRILANSSDYLCRITDKILHC